MLGEKAVELLRELDRARQGTLPQFNEDLCRQALEEMRALFEQNQRDVEAAMDGERHLYAGIQMRHTALERNKRCVLAYLYNRTQVLQKIRWEYGSVLPGEIKYALSEAEIDWFAKYNKSLAHYMKKIGAPGGIDLTQDLKPPKSICIEVRCLIDHGEFETLEGKIIMLKRNSMHFLERTECEQLVRQGIVEHVVAI